MYIKYIRLILLLPIFQSLSACLSFDGIYPKYKDYEGSDYGTLSVKNYATHLITIYKKDDIKQCLVQDGPPRALVLRELFIPDFKNGVFNNSPFKDSEKYLSESRVKAGSYVQLTKRSNNSNISSQTFKFIIENRGYYYFQRIANKPIPILKMDEDINEIFYLLPDKNGTYNNATYSETTKRHYTLDGLLSENDTIIRYKNEIPAKKWDLPECE